MSDVEVISAVENHANERGLGLHIHAYWSARRFSDCRAGGVKFNGLVLACAQSLR
jgi:hypothetical protein